MSNINRKKFIADLGMLGTAAVVSPTVLAMPGKKQERLNQPDKKTRVGVIGCGSVSKPYLAHLSGSPYAEIVSLCDIIPERAQQRAAEYGVDSWYPHIDRMLDGVAFDLLVNLTDMQEHGRLNRIAMEAGKHVWTEKPMASSYEEGKALVELAGKKGVRIWAAPVVVNSPQFAFMSEQIQAGNLGRIAAAHGSYGHLGPNWSSFFYEKGGGSLPDLGVYNIATLTGLLGPALSVTAMLNVMTPTREIRNKGTIQVEAEDNAHLLLEHKSGALSHVQSGFNYKMAHSYESETISTLFVTGTKGRMDMIGYDWAPHAVDRVILPDRQMERMSTDPGTYKWEEGASLICESLATGREPLVKVEHSLHVLEIIESARKSQETGRRIDLNSSFSHPVVE